MATSRPSIEDLSLKRDRCKDALDRAQAELNRQIIANSPVKRGDIIRDEDGTIFRVVSVSVKTFYEEGKLGDRLMCEFQRKRTGPPAHWQKMNINAIALMERVLSGTARIVRHGTNIKHDRVA